MKSIDFLKEHKVYIDQSLELFGDVDTYNETLVEFKNSIDGKLDQIKKYYEEADMANYAIYVHSLKSDCKYFGFMKLAELAYEHEMKSKENDYEYVKANYDALIAEAKVVKKLVYEYMEDDSYTEEVAAPEPEVSTESITDDIILVADDSEVIRVFVNKIFDGAYEIDTAKNGEDALNIIKEHQEDGRIKAILLDLNMPVVDGFAVLDYLQSNNLIEKMPVTVISGDSSREAIEKAFNYPIIDMINKPFNEEKIKSAVEKTIRNAR